MTQENKGADKGLYNPFTRPKFAALERLVCSYLIESLNAPSLQAIIFICRAALLLTKDEIEKLNLDMKAITRVYTVAERLEAAKLGTNEGSNSRHPVHLGSLDFEYDIEPWVKSKAYGYWGSGIDQDELATLSFTESFFVTLSRLSPSGYRSITSDFLQFGTPFAQSLGGLLTSLINPETYTDMLQTYKGVKNA